MSCLKKKILILIPVLSAFFTFPAEAALRKPYAFQNVTMKEGLSSDMVYSIAVLGDEIWFGTYAGGVTLYNRANRTMKAYTTKGEPAEKVDDGKSIQWKNHLSYNHVSTILPDTDRIWFGTYFYGFGGGGISYYHPQKNPSWRPINTNNGRAKKIVSLAVDGDTLWVGSEKGLSQFDKKSETWKVFYSTENGLSGNFVNSLLVQGDVLWIGTNGGVSRFAKSKKTWKTYSHREGLTETEIKSLVKIGERMWAGGIGGSLFEFEPGSDRWKRVEATDPIKHGGINSLVGAKGRLIVCRDNGVSLFDPATGQWESLSSQDGLLSNMVFHVAEDQNGIWFGTDKGASKLVLNP